MTDILITGAGAEGVGVPLHPAWMATQGKDAVPMSKPAFRELVTAFLRDKMGVLAARYGVDSEEYRALARQYIQSPEESLPTEESNLRHYEADVATAGGEMPWPGVERLYRRTLVVEPTLACAAHCRYCIRANYLPHNLSEEELREIARYCGEGKNREELTELLVTGGDPLLAPDRVGYFIRCLIERAPNIRVVRLATRIPMQAPELVTEDVLRLFEKRSGLRFELATQINHRVELFDEVVAALQRIMEREVRIYAQNVLLQGVNDRIETLIDLYDSLRQLGIEAHYLFHCVPLKGMGHLRTTLRRAVELGSALTCSGAVSGRAKPMLAAMTDIGKIVLYDGVVLGCERRHVLLQSKYHVEDRRRWNPGWQIPKTAEVDRSGCLRVWYLDGEETAVLTPQRPSLQRLRREPMSAQSELLRPRRIRPSSLIQHCG